jgi:hypothetical protein
MSEEAGRSRSRSPDRGDAAPDGDAPPQDAAPPADAGADAAPPADGGAPPATDGGAEDVKLYVGNLDYSKFASPVGHFVAHQSSFGL